MRHVVLRPEAARQLDELPKSMRARIHAVLGRLQQWPEVSGAKPLTGNLAGHSEFARVTIAFSFPSLPTI